MGDGAKVIYTAKVRTTGGREGQSRSSDGHLDVRLSIPGAPGIGTNPEQLFAAGWSACFASAIGLAARAAKIALPSGPVIEAEVDLMAEDGSHRLAARLNVSLPGVDRETARYLIEAVHRNCPYSKATHGNIEVSIDLI